MTAEVYPCTLAEYADHQAPRSDAMSCLALHRAAGESDFSDRECALASFFHYEFGRLIGGSLGTAVLGAIFASRLGTVLPSMLPPGVAGPGFLLVGDQLAADHHPLFDVLEDDILHQLAVGEVVGTHDGHAIAAVHRRTEREEQRGRRARLHARMLRRRPADGWNRCSRGRTCRSCRCCRGSPHRSSG